MTDTEKQAITEHLATKVCGWTIRRETLLYGASLVLYCNVDGSLAVSGTFSPLTDANDTAMVMEAWRKQDGDIDIYTHENRVQWSAFVAMGDSDGELVSSDTWTEAVCVAIYRASREGEK